MQPIVEKQNIMTLNKRIIRLPYLSERGPIIICRNAVTAK